MKDESQTLPSPRARKDTLSGDFVIYQPRRGQRYTTDDMLAAWLAVQSAREAENQPELFLDLGSGLCSVPMIVLWAFPGMKGFGVEVSDERVRLGRRSLCANKLDGRFSLVRGDLRDLPLCGRFPLVTSSPPYYELHEGPLSAHADRARVRFELRGGIRDYFLAAAGRVGAGGVFVTVYPYRYRQRALQAGAACGFGLDRQVDVIPRETKPPLISLFAFTMGAKARGVHSDLTIRSAGQRFTDAYRQVRREVGFPEPK